MKGAIEERLAVDARGEIIELKAGGCPWREHLYDLEAELKLEKPIKFCIYEVCAPPGMNIVLCGRRAPLAVKSVRPVLDRRKIWDPQVEAGSVMPALSRRVCDHYVGCMGPRLFNICKIGIHRGFGLQDDREHKWRVQALSVSNFRPMC